MAARANPRWSVVEGELRKVRGLDSRYFSPTVFFFTGGMEDKCVSFFFFLNRNQHLRDISFPLLTFNLIDFRVFLQPKTGCFAVIQKFSFSSCRKKDYNHRLSTDTSLLIYICIASSTTRGSIKCATSHLPKYIYTKCTQLIMNELASG